MRTIKALFSEVTDSLSVIFVYIAGFFLLFVFLRMLGLLSPIATLLFVFVGTGYAFEKKRGAVAMGGIVLYILAWPAMEAWGAWASAAIYGLGILAWFASIGVPVMPKLAWRTVC